MKSDRQIREAAQRRLQQETLKHTDEEKMLAGLFSRFIASAEGITAIVREKQQAHDLTPTDYALMRIGDLLTLSVTLQAYEAGILNVEVGDETEP
jgi:hypothetical protein